MTNTQRDHLKVVGGSMSNKREQLIHEIASVLNAGSETNLITERRTHDREWDVYQATAALKAVTGLCTVYSQDGQDQALDCVGRRDMAALLSLISDRLERSAPADA